MKTLSKTISENRWLMRRFCSEKCNNLIIDEYMLRYGIPEFDFKVHQAPTVATCNELMGQTGTIAFRPDNSVVAATDTRSDGKAFASMF
jgi:hypothetical protein